MAKCTFNALAFLLFLLNNRKTRARTILGGEEVVQKYSCLVSNWRSFDGEHIYSIDFPLACISFFHILSSPTVLSIKQ